MDVEKQPVVKGAVAVPQQSYLPTQRRHRLRTFFRLSTAFFLLYVFVRVSVQPEAGLSLYSSKGHRRPHHRRPLSLKEREELFL